MRVKAGTVDLDGAPDILMWKKEGGRLYAAVRGRSEVIEAPLIRGAVGVADQIEIEHGQSSSLRALGRALGHLK